jgi:ASC-1-like (ASCH) protein
MATLHLHVRKKYFDLIKSGEKIEEYRLDNAYWRKRLSNIIDKIIVYNGYPRKNDQKNILIRPWTGMKELKIQHPEFGSNPVDVFAIMINENNSRTRDYRQSHLEGRFPGRNLGD